MFDGQKDNEVISSKYIGMIYYGTAKAPNGRRHSPARMLRVGQGSTSNCSIQYLVKKKTVTKHNHIVCAYSV